jgi:sugar/nucleoside kinase (ribokinase family)
MRDPLPAVAAGHICLDIIPSMQQVAAGSFAANFQPGHLVEVGTALLSTGGPVSNTGLALHRLGVPTQLICKIGADAFGQIIRNLVSRADQRLAEGIVTAQGEATSYSIIISPPGTDRIFLHNPAANHTFGAADVDYGLVAQAALFHFGYPPMMRKIYQQEGAELVEMLRRARLTGVTTSLDMCYLDPTSESGQVNWRAVLKRALPYVDIFLPSIEEILFMLRRARHDELAAMGSFEVTSAELSALSAELLDMGARMVGFKLGDHGLYLRTASVDRLAEMGRARPENVQAWDDLELWAPCFKVNVVGTTGSGDATIAGFLTALLRGMGPCEAVTSAVAVGACNVEAADALSGLRSWEDTQARIAAGWDRLLFPFDAPGWGWDPAWGLWQKK